MSASLPPVGASAVRCTPLSGQPRIGDIRTLPADAPAPTDAPEGTRWVKQPQTLRSFPPQVQYRLEKSPGTELDVFTGTR